MQRYTFLNRIDYIQALTKAAWQAAAGERISIASMAIDPGEEIVATLLEALAAAATRGAKVTLIIDAINFLTDESGVPFPKLYRPHRPTTATLWNALQELQAAGGNFFITNVPTKRISLPQVGRSHIKGAVIGNEVFIGGCNLDEPKHIDVMVTWQDKKAADTLVGWFRRITESDRVRDAFLDTDTEAALDSGTRLLVDAGVPDQSLIYDEALQLIDEAEKWLFITCQYFPGGPTAHHLAAAHTRGVKVMIAFSHPRSHRGGAPFQYIHELRERSRGLPDHFFSGKLGKRVPKLHAKVLISEKAAMVGSHNYVNFGVHFGTAELALHSTDRHFALALREYTEQQIATVQKASQ